MTGSPVRGLGRVVNSLRHGGIPVTAAKAIRRVDVIRRSRWRQTHQVASLEVAPPEVPRAVVAVIAHWRNLDTAGQTRSADERSAILTQVVESLIDLEAHTVTVVVLSNDAATAARELAARLRSEVASVRVARRRSEVFSHPASRRDIVALQWRPGLVHRHGYYLTWGHVPVLRRATRTGRYTHFLYLEDDTHFTPGHLRYWCTYRAPLAEHSLIPGFVRVERDGGDLYLVDESAPIPSTRPRMAVECPDQGTVNFIAMPNAYQGMYVLDAPLAIEHFRFSAARSPLSSRTVRWGVRERAAIGPIFDDVPSGLWSCNVVPVHEDAAGMHLDPACLIEHLGAVYVNQKHLAFGTIPVGAAFEGPVDVTVAPSLGSTPTEPTQPAGS